MKEITHFLILCTLCFGFADPVRAALPEDAADRRAKVTRAPKPGAQEEDLSNPFNGPLSGGTRKPRVIITTDHDTALPDNGPLIAEFDVSETAGIRRRHDVVHAKIELSTPLPDNAGLVLIRGDQTAPAQFRRIAAHDGQHRSLAIDFIDHFAPLETRRYTVRVEPDAPDLAESGFVLRETDNAFIVSNRGLIEWTIRRDLQGLLCFTGRHTLQYVKPTSAGLMFRTNGQRHRLAEQRPARARATRTGPIACAVQFDYHDWPKGASSSIVELEFVRTKSWIHATWTIEGDCDIQGMEAELQLELAGRETLIDFGAGDFVYTTVRTDETAVLVAGPFVNPSQSHPWSVSRGKGGALEALVVSLPQGIGSQSIGGWAHVMDDRRCTAIAVDEFGQKTRDCIDIDGAGRFRVAREFSKYGDSTSHRLEFWIHFVGMPVHIGARTSPQSMQHPLKVVVIRCR